MDKQQSDKYDREMNRIRERKAFSLHEQGTVNGVRGALVILLGAGAVLTANNTSFIEAHQQAIEGVGAGAIALGGLGMLAAMIRHHQAADVERQIEMEDQYGTE